MLCEETEAAYPDKALLPSEPIGRNKNRQLMRITEFYSELPNRRLLPFSFRNLPAPEPLIAVSTALTRLQPLIYGSLDQSIRWRTFIFYVATVAKMVGKTTGVDLKKRNLGLENCYIMLAEDPVSQRVAADTEANLEGFLIIFKVFSKQYFFGHRIARFERCIGKRN